MSPVVQTVLIASGTGVAALTVGFFIGRQFPTAASAVKRVGKLTPAALSELEEKRRAKAATA